jgi:acetyl-CoA C-acetyltransferase
MRALIERTGIDPAAVDDVVVGCVSQIGAQSLDLARNAWLTAGLPESVPGVTVDRQCGSSQQAVHFAAALVKAGVNDLVVAGGIEVMSAVPILSTADPKLGYGEPWSGRGWTERYHDEEISQFRGAELIAERWDISREDMEAFALASHQHAARAWDEGRFDREVVPYDGVARDEGFRPDTSLEKMATLKTLKEGGRLTAATSSQISDGAAMLLIASEDGLRKNNLTPRARIHSMAVVGSDPVLMLTGPIPATEKILESASVSVDDIDAFEVNEAFASVVLAWHKTTGAALEKTNVNGGAIALGHPLGASGARLMTTLLHELERSGGRLGMQTMCEGGGQANATIIERL